MILYSNDLLHRKPHQTLSFNTRTILLFPQILWIRNSNGTVGTACLCSTVSSASAGKIKRVLCDWNNYSLDERGDDGMLLSTVLGWLGYRPCGDCQLPWLSVWHGGLKGWDFLRGRPGIQGGCSSEQGGSHMASGDSDSDSKTFPKLFSRSFTVYILHLNLWSLFELVFVSGMKFRSGFLFACVGPILRGHFWKGSFSFCIVGSPSPHHPASWWGSFWAPCCSLLKSVSVPPPPIIIQSFLLWLQRDLTVGPGAPPVSSCLLTATSCPGAHALHVHSGMSLFAWTKNIFGVFIGIASILYVGWDWLLYHAESLNSWAWYGSLFS